LAKLPDLKTIYQVINWHQSNREKPPGESVGLFAVLPKEIACQFPSIGKEGEDSSPAHVTVLYIGDMPRQFEKKLIKVVGSICEKIRPFKLRLGRPRKFVNDEGQIILHSPVKSNRLHKLNDLLKQELMNNQINVVNKFPEYKPHVTIAYCNSRKELKAFKDVHPEGEWMIDSLWVWGGAEPHLIQFK